MVPVEVKLPTLIACVVVDPRPVTESKVEVLAMVAFVVPETEMSAPAVIAEAILVQVGAAAPPDVRNCPDVPLVADNPSRLDALIVPVPVNVNDAPVPTIIAALVLVPPVIALKAREPPPDWATQLRVPVPLLERT